MSLPQPPQSHCTTASGVFSELEAAPESQGSRLGERRDSPTLLASTIGIQGQDEKGWGPVACSWEESEPQTPAAAGWRGALLGSEEERGKILVHLPQTLPFLCTDFSQLRVPLFALCHWFHCWSLEMVVFKCNF